MTSVGKIHGVGPLLFNREVVSPVTKLELRRLHMIDRFPKGYLLTQMSLLFTYYQYVTTNVMAMASFVENICVNTF